MDQSVTVRDRWLGAVCYLSVFVLVPCLAPEKSAFLARHCRQGFALFCIEILALLLILIIDATLGLIPLLGFLVVILLRLVLFVLFLSLSALGFAKALFGEEWRIPYLDELAERIPIEQS
ncbi:MAG: hypothetical protein AB7V45_17085 [Candidatus Krumholzibacteriia bacterium]